MARYNPPTTSPIGVIQARNAALEEANREANRAIGTQPFQAVRKLTRQVEQLQQQQEQLQQQQEQLEKIVLTQGEIIGQLQAVVNQIVIPQSGSASTNSPVSVGSAWADYAPVSFTVPAGYSKAAVIGVGSALIATAAINLRVSIGSSAGQSVGVAAVQVASSSSVGHATTLTGLSGGQKFSVRCQAQVTSAGTTALFATAAQVIFLR